MDCLWRIHLFIAIVKLSVALENKHIIPIESPIAHNLFYSNLLKTIQRGEPFQNLLIIEDNDTPKDLRLKAVYHFPLPKVLLSRTGASLKYKKHFNIEMLTVVIMYDTFNVDMFQILAETLAYICQTRILVIAVNVGYVDEFKAALQQQAQTHKMTRVLLHSLKTKGETLHQYHILHPYPQYHWYVSDIIKTNSSKIIYFPTHWHNLQNITLLTLIDQEPPRTFVYEDSQGKQHLSGTLSKLVMLFAEKYNASLQMYRPIIVGSGPHFTEVNKLVAENKLDIPMVMETTRDDQWQNMTDAFGISEIVLMVPRPTSLSTMEIFGYIFKGYFLKTFIALSLAFSIIYSGALYFVDGITHRLDFILSSTALSGTLGLSFPTRNTRNTSLRIIYFLIGLVGIVLSSMFAGNLNTYFTHPPYHRPINTFYDLVHSKVKILISKDGASLMGSWFEDNNIPMDSIIFSTNRTFIIEARNQFNTSFAYYIFSPAWSMMERQQYFHSEKLFFTPPAMKFYTLMLWGILLPYNSPHKEAMNRLIHSAHNFGLMKAWEQQVFADLLKLKQISIRDPNQPIGRKVFSANDFFWVWSILLFGLMVSLIIFLLEIVWFKIASKLKWNKVVKKFKE